MVETLHQIARSGALQDGEDFFRETTDSNGEQAANSCDGMQRTPLHLACWAGKPSMIGLLLKHRADCMAEAQDGFTPLHFSSQAGCAEGCRLLLGSGAKVDAKLHKTKKTPLHFAAGKGHLEVVRVLIEAGADVSSQTSKGQTPLSLANKAEVKAALLSAADSSVPQADGEAPSAVAAGKAGAATKSPRRDGGAATEGARSESLAGEGAGAGAGAEQMGKQSCLATGGVKQPGKVEQGGGDCAGGEKATGTLAGAGAGADGGAGAGAGELVEAAVPKRVGGGEAGESEGVSASKARGVERVGSLAERRRKKRKLAAAAAAAAAAGRKGVSLSHLDGGGEAGNDEV